MLSRALPCFAILRLIPLIVPVIALPASAEDSFLTRFGVVGDGLADDTAAIEKAIRAGGVLRFPQGIYRLTHTVIIPLNETGFVSLAGDGVARFVMAGAGPAFHFLGTHQGTAAPDSLKANIFERQRAPMVDGVEIVGAHPEADGIEASGTLQLTLTRVMVHDARHAIHLTQRNRNVIISDSHVYHNRGIGIYLDHVDLHQINVTGCHISYNAGGGVVTRGGGVRNLHLGTCDIESNMSNASPATANVLIDATDGSTAEVSIVGCTIQHHPAPGAANVRFIGRGKSTSPDETLQWGHLSICDNVLSDVEVNVDLQDVRSAVITGNTFGGAYQHDLRMRHCRHIAIGSNTFDRNPPYVRGKAAAVKGGLLFEDCQEVTLTGLHLNGVRQHRAAIQLENCDTFNIMGCTVLDCDGSGLRLVNVHHSLVSGCLIADRRPQRLAVPSIFVDGGSNNTLTNNKVMPE